MRVHIGADHRGRELANHLSAQLTNQGQVVTLCVPGDTEMWDYPEPAFTVATSVSKGEADFGILLCGTGIGTSIAANKVTGVRAAVVHDELTAELSRSHNDANVLCLSADLLGQRLVEKIVELWLRTTFSGGRHERRVAKIADIERGEDPAEK